MTKNKHKIAEEKFLKELNLFNIETEILVRYVYSQGALNEVIINSKSINRAVNKNPSFWNSVLLSFVDSMFIVLGRIFDTNNQLNQKVTIHTLFKLITEEREIFSKESFSKRWIVSHGNMLDYKDKYMEGFYQMSKEDWKELKKLKSALTSEYQNLYRPIRDSIAHRILTDNDQVNLAMSKVPVRDMEKFCTKLRNLHEGLWQLYHNGRGPIAPLRTGKYSSKGFVHARYEEYQPGPLSYQYSSDAKYALLLLSKGNSVK